MFTRLFIQLVSRAAIMPALGTETLLCPRTGLTSHTMVGQDRPAGGRAGTGSCGLRRGWSTAEEGGCDQLWERLLREAQREPPSQGKEKPLRQRKSPKLGGVKPGMKGPGRNNQGGNSGHLCSTKYKALFLALKKFKIERTGGSSKT